MLTAFRDFWKPDISCRAVSSELMDDQTVDERALFVTLNDFKYINRYISKVQQTLRETVIADMRMNKMRTVSFLDVASGGSDTALWFSRYCKSHGIGCTVYCLDNDPRALRYSRYVCRNDPSINFIESDARDLAQLGIRVDYAFSNHFFHHLEDQDIPDMLRAIRDCCRHGFVVNDLERASRWFIGFTILGGLFWRHGFTLADGRMSIRRGFDGAELQQYVIEAGIDATITRGGVGHWRITNIRWQ